MWRELRGGKPGVVVRRQYVVGRYIADFAVPSVRVVIEVDGACPASRRVADARRDQGTEYVRASGRSCVDCAVLGRRWRDAYGTMLADSDFYVVGVRPDATQWWGPWPNMWVALWQSLDSGRVWVCDASQGSFHVYENV